MLSEAIGSGFKFVKLINVAKHPLYSGCFCAAVCLSATSEITKSLGVMPTLSDSFKIYCVNLSSSEK